MVPPQARERTESPGQSNPEPTIAAGTRPRRLRAGRPLGAFHRGCGGVPEENPEENLGRGKLFFEPSDQPSTILRRPPQPPQRQPPPQPPLPRLTGAGPAPRAHPLPPPRRRRCSPRPHIGSSAALPAPPPPPPPGMAQGSTSLWQQQQRGTAPWTSSSAPQVTARERRRTGRKRERRRGGGCLSRRPPRHGGVWRPLRPPLRKRPARPRAGAPVVRVSPLDPPPTHTRPPQPGRVCLPPPVCFSAAGAAMPPRAAR